LSATHHESPDGHFDLYYHDGWAHLTVYPPAETGRPVYREDVQNRMKLLRIPRVDGAEIKKMIGAADGEPRQLVEWPDGQRLASVISVTISDDALSAVVHITAPKRGARPPTAEEVVSALEAGGIRHGIDRDAVLELLRDGTYEEEVMVGKGTLPVHARSGEIDYHFNPDRGKPYLVMEYDRINLKELNFIEDKSAGALLAELKPPVEPVDGRAVTGETLSADTIAEPVELVAGENTELTDGGQAIHATADGNVRLVGEAVTIEPIVTVTDVNYETGNIKCDGSVVVEKSIADGFVIEAGGDVQVGRGVGRATIIAGGNVLRKSGSNGGGEGRIRCGGNLVAKYIEGSSVDCEVNVFVEEAIMHSDLSAGASDLIVGGSLWCKKLGSVAEAPMTVSIGISPHVLTSYRQAAHEIELTEDRLEKTQEQLRQVDHSLSTDKDAPRMLQARVQLQADETELTATIAEIRNNARQLRDKLEASKNSMLVVEDTIFAGSLVSFGRAEYRPPTQGARATVLTHRHGEIKESGYNPAERPKIDFEESVTDADDTPDEIPAGAP